MAHKSVQRNSEIFITVPPYAAAYFLNCIKIFIGLIFINYARLIVTNFLILLHGEKTMRGVGEGGRGEKNHLSVV
jgi:hypothetical protein